MYGRPVAPAGSSPLAGSLWTVACVAPGEIIGSLNALNFVPTVSPGAVSPTATATVLAPRANNRFASGFVTPSIVARKATPLVTSPGVAGGPNDAHIAPAAPGTVAAPLAYTIAASLASAFTSAEDWSAKAA